jgi:hypothetical protein
VSEPPQLEPWQAEALAWLAELTGGVVEGDRVRVVRGPTTAAAFVGTRSMIAGAPIELEVLVRTRVETASGDESAAAEQGPFRSPAPRRRRVRGRPRIALGARFATSDLTIVEPDRPLPPADPRLQGVLFASDATDAEALEVLGAADLQSRLAELFALRCDSVSINEGGEWIFLRFRLQRPDGEGEHLRPSVEEGARVRALVDAYVALLGALPVFVGAARERSWLSKLARGFLWLTPLVGIPASIAGVSWRPTIDPPIALVGASVALWALGLLGAWLVVRRKRRATRKRLRSLAGLGLLSLLGPPSVCLGLGLLINGCDPGARERHSVEVLSKHRHKSRHYFDVKDFRPGASGFVTVTAEYDLWERAKPGERVVLVVGPGRLGWPWLARVEQAPPR